MHIRTVLDTRKKSVKHSYAIGLLASSWHKHVRHQFSLEVYHVGELSAALGKFFDQLGIWTRSISANLNDSIIKTSNTIEGAIAPSNDRLLLVDNDVIFVRALTEIDRISSQAIAGAVPNARRISENQWKEIEQILGFKVLPADVVPCGEVFKYLTGGESPKRLRRVYVNGGVLILPSGLDLKTTWESHLQSISNHFENHPLRNSQVYETNMTGLATAIASYGKFEWLPDQYNYRPFLFALGRSEFEEIQIVHLTGNLDTPHAITAQEWCTAYREKFLEQPFDDVSIRLSPADRNRATNSIYELSQFITQLISEYQIEEIALGR